MQDASGRSQKIVSQNQRGLSSLIDGYDTLVQSMINPSLEINIDDITQAYQMAGTSITNDFKTKLAAAEYLFRSGVPVACVGHGNGTYWDTHNDDSGTRQRQYFGEMMAGLQAFTSRMLGTPEYNVTIVFVSEHSRIPEISNHGPHLSSIVISDSAVGGASTGVTNNRGIIENAPPPKAFKSCIADLCGLKGADNPFGPNPHAKIVKSG